MKKFILLIIFVLTLSACSKHTAPASPYIPQSKPGVIETGTEIEGNQVQPTLAATESPIYLK
ncbi:hypothetical protein EHS13_13905 [Paenibacillus psychroresistens]|uniref:Lipoprotein n=1 Tax=Paenibacillus psychroresistens TaxID=1778678 RepID=A0A6B8RHD7_9BACL|nr:lipoprotein [Paenibacillus psychroresistens]QGQ95891.1 hypothetical protein EHS13_13905 [Paenibacillus psychroresistens]